MLRTMRYTLTRNPIYTMHPKHNAEPQYAIRLHVILYTPNALNKMLRTIRCTLTRDPIYTKRPEHNAAHYTLYAYT